MNVFNFLSGISQEKIRNKFRYGLFIKALQDRFQNIGIKIRPYYLVQEFLIEELQQELEKGFENYECGFLDPKDMIILAQNRDWNLSEEFYLGLLKEGKKCFGVKLGGQLAAFTWVNFDECHDRGDRFSLKENEAYLFDAYTFREFRGKKIAPFMRYRSYKALYQMGINKFYSISEYFNTPSIKFKKRLGARFLKLGLFIELFNKYRWTIKLKT